MPHPAAPGRGRCSRSRRTGWRPTCPIEIPSVHWSLVQLVACGGGSPGSGAPDAAVGTDSRAADAAAGTPLDGIGEVELVQGGFMFTEGPQWREAEGELVFSDIPARLRRRAAERHRAGARQQDAPPREPRRASPLSY